ncbi:unnamed protein product [Cuscuta campestris]|uniref:BRCT domain-containing protein n=1 Tax=Cuscuta campestris TaxID=132261 RepID=A0A484KBN7_9ASTE|nr:unnamed protein product [Cuscuta campestris]
MMEAEVKDSEEGRDDIPAQSNGERKMVTSSHNSRSANQSLLKPDSLNVTNSKISRSPQDAKNLLQSFKKQDLSEDLNLCASRALSDQHFNKVSSSAGKGPKHAQAEMAACSDKLPDLPLNDNVLAYGATCTEQNSGVFKKSYSRKSGMKNSLVMEEEKGNGGTPLTVNAGRHDKGQNLISLLDLECDGLHTAGADSHTKAASPFGNEQSYISSEKRMLTTPSSSSKKQRKTHTQGTRRDGALIASGAEVLEAVSYAKNGLESTNRSPVKIFNIPTPDGARELCCKEALETGLPETMEDVSADVEVKQKELQGFKLTSPGSRAKTENLNELAGVQLLEGNTESQPRKHKKRCLSMKTEKSKQAFGKGHASNQKGSIYLNKNGESAVCSTGGEEIKGKDDLNSEKADVASMHNGDSIKESGKSKSLDSEAKKTRHVFDATEAPDDTEDELNDGVPSCVKAFDFESPHSAEEEEGSMLNTDFHPVENCDLETMVDKADLNPDATYVKKQPKGKKRSLSKDKEVIPRATQVSQSKEGAQKKRITTKNSMKGKGKQVNNSMEAEKENISNANCEMHESHKKSCKSKDIEDKGEVNRGLSESNKDHKIGKVTPETCKEPNKGVETTENRYFIVSGHKLQKKEFQQVIKRLKGRSCRDSHNWSYQATHFILPDPVRRTEKFFAAAASGRWILKVDYLTACNEAGMFLAEEPYEWHKKGLSEDLAISLEAPRTWRLLRQRTGHGAFYGMRIVTYGEINRPSLDTLKRVVKAGHGTILATCPSYARFLKSDIDFAIVCPGTPRQDMWVQEFLRLKIPCVSVDYLVEYICKPGYSLDKHVLYNTHAWAEESLQKLLTRLSGEVEVDDLAPPEDCDDNGGNDIRPCKSAKRKRLSST